MKSVILAVMLFASSIALSQPVGVAFQRVDVAPSGLCQKGDVPKWVVSTGDIWACRNIVGTQGTWTINAAGGSVNAGTTGQVAYYPGNGTAVSGLAGITSDGTGWKFANTAWNKFSVVGAGGGTTMGAASTSDSGSFGGWSQGIYGFTGVNPDLRANWVFSEGWNIGPNGAPLIVGVPASRSAWEQHYQNPAYGNDATFETHMASFYDAAGVEYRAIDSDFDITAKKAYDFFVGEQFQFSDTSNTNNWFSMFSDGSTSTSGGHIIQQGYYILNQATDGGLGFEIVGTGAHAGKFLSMNEAAGSIDARTNETFNVLPTGNFVVAATNGSYIDGAVTGANIGTQTAGEAVNLGSSTSAVAIDGGTNALLRCTTAGTLPIGALTIAAGNYGASTDTGIRVK